MSEGGENEGIRVQLARMEGKLDLSNLRHDQMDQWKVTVDQRLHRQGNELMVVKAEVGSVADHEPRITSLETHRTREEGQRKGIITTLNVAWSLGGGGFVALVLAILNKAGLL